MKSLAKLLSAMVDADLPQVFCEPEAFKNIKEATPNGRLLLITSPGCTKRGVTQDVLNQLEGSQIEIYDQVEPNPELDCVDFIAKSYGKQGISSLLAIGGGSVLDTAKALSILLPKSRPGLLNHILREGRQVSFTESIPLVAVPTTSGSGAEVTPFATIWDSKTRRKYSLQDPLMAPATVLLAPELTLSLPPRETRHSGLDAISHSLESLWNRHAAENSRQLATEALARTIQALPTTIADPNNLPARRLQQEASFLAGLAIRHTRTALAHSISYPLTLNLNIPHGLACSFTLATLWRILERSKRTPELPTELVDGVKELLTALAPECEILTLTTPDKILSLAFLMATPDRSDNFILNVDPLLIQQVLREALAVA